MWGWGLLPNKQSPTLEYLAQKGLLKLRQTPCMAHIHCILYAFRLFLLSIISLYSLLILANSQLGSRLHLVNLTSHSFISTVLTLAFPG